MENVVVWLLVRPFQAGMPEENPYIILVPPKITDWIFLGK